MRTMSMEQRKVYIKEIGRAYKDQARYNPQQTKLEYISKNTPQNIKDKMLDTSMIKRLSNSSARIEVARLLV
jgi:hypothetical protein